MGLFAIEFLEFDLKFFIQKIREGGGKGSTKGNMDLNFIYLKGGSK
jgi:hypothetical protein